MSDLFWLGTAVNSFIDQAKFKATKILSGRRPSCCDENQFHAKDSEYLTGPKIPIFNTAQ